MPSLSVTWTLSNEPVEVDEPLMFPLIVILPVPIISLELRSKSPPSCGDVSSTRSFISPPPAPPPVPKPLAAADSDTAVVKLFPPTIICPNEPVEVTEPLIVPLNSKPFVKAPLIAVAICPLLLMIFSGTLSNVS